MLNLGRAYGKRRFQNLVLKDDKNKRLRIMDVIGILMEEIARLQRAIADSDALTWEGATFPNRGSKPDSG